MKWIVLKCGTELEHLWFSEWYEKQLTDANQNWHHYITAFCLLHNISQLPWPVRGLTHGYFYQLKALCHYTPRNLCGGTMYIVILVRSFIRPFPSLIRYSSKTAEQNFRKFSGIVHYLISHCTSNFEFLSAWFWGFPEQNKDFAITT